MYQNGTEEIHWKTRSNATTFEPTRWNGSQENQAYSEKSSRVQKR